MLERLLEVAFRNRAAVAAGFVLAAALGVWGIGGLEVDAFPDTTPIQVQINTTAPALGPEDVERRITFPIESAIGGIPHLENVRSISKFGFSQVIATFGDKISMFDARQLVAERLGSVELGEGIAPPALGPIATGLGEVFHYLVRSPDGSHDLTELRTIHDAIVKPELRRVPGVAEINTWGGYEKVYEVEIRPQAMLAHGVTLTDVAEAVRANNRDAGGGVVTSSGEGLLLHGRARLGGIADLEGIVVRSQEGIPVRLRDVARIEVDHEIRRGAVTADGRGEAVLGLGFMLMGENAREVTQRLAARVEAVRAALPEGVVLDVVYSRTELVDRVIHTVTDNLLFGGVLVAGTLFLLLGSVRAGLIVALAIPLSFLFAALGMRELGIAASLLSLGALDFGILVDGAVVTTENVQRRVPAGLRGADRAAAVLRASREVVRPVFFGTAIIALVMVPVLALEGPEGKLFRPMAVTFMLALGGALLVALLLSPALALWCLPRTHGGRTGRLLARLNAGYATILDRALARRRAVLAGAGAILLAGAALGPRLGAEFMPRLNEGTIVLNLVRLAGISIEQSVDYNTRIERLILDAFPDEVAHVWSRIGTAETATDPMGTELTDVFFTLHPRERWTRARTQDELVDEVRALLADLPGQTIGYTQPIEMRVAEMAAGIRSDFGILIQGDDFAELERIARDVEAVVVSTRGAVDVNREQLTGQPLLSFRVDAAATSRLGVPADEVLQVIEAAAGLPAGEMTEGQQSFPILVRLPEAMRRDPEALAAVPVSTSGGAVLPLAALTERTTAEAPATITREWGRRRGLVQANVHDRDVASFVGEVRDRIAREVSLPPGYTVEFGGQFEQMERANRRFAVLVPLVLALVFGLLVLGTGRIRDAAIVFTAVPLAAVGGILALWLRDLPFSVSAAVGFIALSGIAVLNGQILVTTFRNALDEGTPPWSAARTAGLTRLRPVLATAITDVAGFLPMAFSTGVGAEIQRPLATVVIGGVVSSTLLTLVVLPAFLSGRSTDPAAGVES